MNRLTGNRIDPVSTTGQRTDAVRQRAPEHRGERHRQETDRHRAGDAGDGPAGVRCNRPEEDRQRKHRSRSRRSRAGRLPRQSPSDTRFLIMSVSNPAAGSQVCARAAARSMTICGLRIRCAGFFWSRSSHDVFVGRPLPAQAASASRLSILTSCGPEPPCRSQASDFRLIRKVPHLVLHWCMNSTGSRQP